MAVETFKEYLKNYAKPETVKTGNELISKTISEMSGIARQRGTQPGRYG